MIDFEIVHDQLYGRRWRLYKYDINNILRIKTKYQKSFVEKSLIYVRISYVINTSTSDAHKKIIQVRSTFYDNSGKENT